MRGSATKLRWLVLGGFLLLGIVVAGFFGVARYKAGLIWQRILARNGVNLRQETNGITYSQSSHGRTVFTLHASKAKPEGKNKLLLQDAVLILYGREPGRDDRIYGKQFEYDQEAGVARALGEVYMDLQTPGPGGKPPVAGAAPSLNFGPDAALLASPGAIHVRTSGLVYMRKLGVVATGEPAEFRYGGVTCTSTGAEFDTAQSVVRLLADVRLAGTVHDASFSLTAGHAELHQGDNTADLSTVVLSSGDRSVRAANAVLHLRKDGTLAAAEANGAVEVHRATTVVSAPAMTASFAEDNRPQHARLFTGVRFAENDRARPAQGGAGTVDLVWRPGGELASVTASRDVTFVQNGLGRSGEANRRQLRADQAVGSFAPVPDHRGKAVLQRLDLSGNAVAGTSTKSSAAPSAAKPAETTVSADRIVTDFVTGPEGQPQAEKLQGTGHTRLQQVQASGARQESTGELLEIAFAPAGAGQETQLVASSAVQTGHVEVQSWAAPKLSAAGQTAAAPEVTTGHAARAIFAQGERTLTLAGSGGGKATLQQSDGELAGDTIVLHQGSGDAELSGGVAATSAGRDGGPATHILASRARLLHAAGLSIFAGEAQQPAQLWQGASQVQAAEITLDGKTHGLAARPATADGSILAIFAAEGERAGASHRRPSPAVREPTSVGPTRGSGGQDGRVQDGQGQTPSEAARSAVRVVAGRMDYDDKHRVAVFAGDVRVSGVTGDVSADRGTAFLQAARPERRTGGGAATGAATAPAPGGPALSPELSGSLERLVMAGDVRLAQPPRSGTGEQLTFLAATSSFVLTGTPAKPPRVQDEGGSAITGATLLFNRGDDTVVVAGAKGEHRPGGPARVHAETDVR